MLNKEILKGYDDATTNVEIHKVESLSEHYLKGYEQGLLNKIRWAEEELSEFKAKINKKD